jgi:hypothetical protein
MPRWRGQTPPVASVIVAAVALAMAFVFFSFIDKYAVNLLFSDHWDTYRPMFEERNLWQVFTRQHGPPRLGLGLVMTKFVADLTHWNTRAESFLVGVLIAIGLMCAGILKQRLFGKVTISDVILPLMFFTLVQYESLVVVPLPSHGAMPLVLLMLLGIAWTLPLSATRYAAIVVLNFLLVFTGFGVFVAPITPLLLLLDVYHARRQGKAIRLPVVSLLLSLVSVWVFSIGYTVDPAANGASAAIAHPRDVIWFIALLLARFIQIPYFISPVVSTIVGLVILMIMVALVLTHGRNLIAKGLNATAISTTVVLLVGFTLLFAFNAAVGRMVMGVTFASQASRYATLLIPGYVGVYFGLLTIRALIPKVVALAALSAVLLPLPLTTTDVQAINQFTIAKRAWKECYLATEDWQECQRRSGLAIYPAPDELADRLVYLKTHRLNLFAEQ